MHRTVVLPGVDEELDELKRKYDGLEDLLNKTSKNIASSIPDHFSLDLNVIFFPQIGFLISMPMGTVTGRAEYEGGDDGHPQWDRVFSTSLRVYYRDYRMEELNSHFGDMYAVICSKSCSVESQGHQ
jgi:DNA mismatch repair protein MSH5